MITDRIKKVADYQRVSISSLEKKIGASDGVLRRSIKNGTDLHTKWLIALSDIYPNINPAWLLTGRGDMLLGEGAAQPVSAVYKEGATLPAELSDAKRIPLVDAYAVGGFGSVDFKLEQQDVKDYYVIPKFKDRQIDFMIEISGSSMYPKYSSGDVIACRVIHERAFIQWNQTHVVATREQGILVKRLRESEMEGSLLAVSDNQNYPPFHIPEREITGLALVVGVIRLE